MNTHYGKSRFVRQKQSTKSGIEDNTPEEEELKKYRELIEKLDGEFKIKTGKVKTNSMYSSSMNMGGTSNGNNKSSYMRRTASRTKEVLNDRDFLINFMNNDTMPILPKNMHLLADNDTNQSISDETKYKNLANLMIDDKETVVETHFVRNVDDKMILKLYTALSRKSKDIFMDENHEEQSKNRILFHKLNNIKIPKIEIYDVSMNENNDKNNDNNSNDSFYSNKEQEKEKEKEKENLNKNDLNFIQKKNTKSNLKKFDFNDKNLDKTNNKKNKVTINEKNIKELNENNITPINEKKEEEKEEKNKLEFNEHCKYNKKNLNKIIKIPTLETYNPYKDKYHSRRYHRNRPMNLWEPEVDGDFLGYINHNIICIEDIYNKDKDKTINDTREEEIKPIEAKEIYYDNGSNNQNNSFNTHDNDNKDEHNKSVDINNPKKESSNAGEEEENDNRIRNKFCEFKDRHPNLIEISLMVDQAKLNQNTFHNELKDIYYSKINEVGEYSEDIFPPKGVDLKSLKIYRYALNNERNEEMSTDSFTILSNKPPTPPATPKSYITKKNSSKKKKTIFNKRKISEDIHIKKKGTSKLNENINLNFSALIKRESDKVDFENRKETNKVNEDENILKNNINLENTFSLIEKGSQNIEDNSIDKKSLSDNLNKIFSSSNIEENNNNDKNDNNDNNDVKINESKSKDENNLNSNLSIEKNHKEENKDEKKNIFNSDDDSYKEEIRDNILNLSSSRNSGD